MKPYSKHFDKKMPEEVNRFSGNQHCAVPGDKTYKEALLTG